MYKSKLFSLILTSSAHYYFDVFFLCYELNLFSLNQNNFSKQIILNIPNPSKFESELGTENDYNLI